jgi:hypothetical protein
MMMLLSVQSGLPARFTSAGEGPIVTRPPGIIKTHTCSVEKLFE